MDAFLTAWTQLLGNEGGYVDNPADPGGATMYGVTQRVARNHGYTGDMRDLPIATAQAIAKQEYWDRYSCDEFDPRIAFQVLDTAYNGGYAARWLQQAVGVEQDGIIGPATIAAVKAQNVYQTIMRFDSYRLSYLAMLGTWPTFGRGWANRIAHNLLLGAENVSKLG
jgi:lysozyme family protein